MNAKEKAKRLKAVFKKELPLVEFKVRSDSGWRIVVEWTGGDDALWDQVERLIGEFAGKRWRKSQVMFFDDDGIWYSICHHDSPIEYVMVKGTGEFVCVEKDTPILPGKCIMKGWYERLECGHFYRKKGPKPDARKRRCYLCSKAKSEQNEADHEAFLRTIGISQTKPTA